jgi:methyl coenzyme M reductase subunit C-like uncharacterized protein (methanogenesis marker protein 7)
MISLNALIFDGQIAEDDLGEDWMESYVTRILNAKYEKLDIDEFIATQTHLDEVQRNCRELLGVIALTWVV